MYPLSEFLESSNEELVYANFFIKCLFHFDGKEFKYFKILKKSNIEGLKHSSD
jgi:hypothetical protein